MNRPSGPRESVNLTARQNHRTVDRVSPLRSETSLPHRDPGGGAGHREEIRSEVVSRLGFRGDIRGDQPLLTDLRTRIERRSKMISK